MEGGRKEGREGKKGERERDRIIVQTVPGLYFLDQWRRVKSEVSDEYHVTYLRPITEAQVDNHICTR